VPIAQQVAALQAQVAALQASNDELPTRLQYFSLVGKDLYITGANLHIVSGSGATDGTTNGLGNLIVGYNELRTDGVLSNKNGSHNVVLGKGLNYSSFGGLVVGLRNALNGAYASVTGGFVNTASGFSSSVSGGKGNMASLDYSSVSGGTENTASGDGSSVSGGTLNHAIGQDSSVSGGSANGALGEGGSVSGGRTNLASGNFSSVTGGFVNNALGSFSSISGGNGLLEIDFDGWAAAIFHFP
jgi:hypothetical protein